jgi:hypothetical protein
LNVTKHYAGITNYSSLLRAKAASAAVRVDDFPDQNATSIATPKAFACSRWPAIAEVTKAHAPFSGWNIGCAS